jgi:hypothetical protein
MAHAFDDYKAREQIPFRFIVQIKISQLHSIAVSSGGR